jgi:hypothetical protein
MKSKTLKGKMVEKLASSNVKLAFQIGLKLNY